MSTPLDTLGVLGEDRRNVRAQALLNAIAIKGMALGEIVCHDLTVTLSSQATGGPGREVARLLGMARASLRRVSTEVGHPDVIHLQTGRRPHLNAISTTVRQATDAEGLVLLRVAPSGGDGVTHHLVFGRLRPSDLATAATSQVRASRQWRRAMDAVGATRTESLTLRLAAVRQTARALSARRFMRRIPTLRVVGADYDRGDPTAILFAAAKSLGLATFSVQHGVIMSSDVASNYSPLVADAICVWGEAAKAKLEREAVESDRITIVGNPTLDHAAFRPDPTGGPGNTIYLALSSPDLVMERQLVSAFARLRDASPDGASFVVRLHPARSTEDYQWIEDEFGLAIGDRAQQPADVFAHAKALLVTDSTLGLEALRAGVPVAVLRVPAVPLAQGQGYVLDLGLQQISSPEDLRSFLATWRGVDESALQRVFGAPVGDRLGRYLAALITPQ